VGGLLGDHGRHLHARRAGADDADALARQVDAVVGPPRGVQDPAAEPALPGELGVAVAVPDSADPVARLQHRHRHPEPAQGVQRPEPGETRTDHENVDVHDPTVTSPNQAVNTSVDSG